MLNVIGHLDRQEFSPAVCVLRKGGKLDQKVVDMGLPLLEAPFSIPARPYGSLLPRARAAAQVFRPYRFELWHSFHYSSDYSEAIIARLAGARAWVYTKKNMNWGERAWKLRSLLASEIAAQNTDMLKEFFSSPWLRKKTRLLPRGVDAQRFHPQAAPVLGLRHSLDIPQDAAVIACVAHLLPVKGHPTLLQAFARLEHQPAAHLWLAGKALDTQYADELHRQTGELGLDRRVHFLGDIENIPALLAEADIFCLPTWARWRMEGSPVAMLEAMACAKASVGTDIPGVRDQIQSGVHGLLAAPENPAALAAALQDLIDSPGLRTQLGTAARQRVEQHYTIEIEAQKHRALYHELLGLPA